MVVIGIDPGFNKTGYGIIEVISHGDKVAYKLLICGAIKMDKMETSQKLIRLEEALIALIETYQPDIGGVEDIFLRHCPQTTIKLGKVLGVVQCTLGKHMKIVTLNVHALRKIIGFKVKVSKENVREKIEEILLPHGHPIATLDASDAIAVALARAMSYEL